MAVQPFPEPAPQIKPPPSDDSIVWRYMDFTKFVALLEAESLFFSRLDLLGDPFEGAFPDSQPVGDRLIASLPAGAVPPGATVLLHGGIERSYESTRRWMYVSCWYCSTTESAAMWKLFAQSAEAIAVKSRVSRLRTLSQKLPGPTPGFKGGDKLYVGMVEYIDYAAGQIPPDYISRCFRKRQSFAHENELRALFFRYPVPFKHDVIPDHTGIGLSVVPSELIEAVYVAPQASHWYADLVRSIVERYGLSAPVCQSALDAKPLY
jgi:hypothetical protein